MSTTTSTHFLKLSELSNNWILIDAEDLVLGRISSEIAKILRGKHKASFTPGADCGDNVIVINAEKVHLTGNKMARKDGKLYYRHTGHPGGIKETTAGKTLEGAHPERVIELAVERMLPKDGPLTRQQFKRLYVYKGATHPHEAQKPVKLDLAARNEKNRKIRTKKKAA
jgi:large subunit ribosomal protein L13